MLMFGIHLASPISRSSPTCQHLLPTSPTGRSRNRDRLRARDHHREARGASRELTVVTGRAAVNSVTFGIPPHSTHPDDIAGAYRDAKNPEGVLAEAVTLSGFSTLLTLRPRRTGLPARSQSHLSVTSTPIWSCLQVGSATIGLRFSGGQVERQRKFRDLALFFATRGSGLSPGDF
jgi:hypothetical protein